MQNNHSTENPPVASAQGLPPLGGGRGVGPLAILTEKPSVARDIARVLGITGSKDGYMEGNGYIITWAFGHLIMLAPPESYGTGTLPILPSPFRLVARREKTANGYEPDKAALKQLKIIKSVFDRCSQIISATDAGREGELVFRNIYKLLECNKPFSRLWISSLTDKAITEGFANLKSGSDYDGLYLAAEARSHADWLVGLNGSMTLAQVTGDSNNSLGRVQTPTLAMICARYRENRNFCPQPFWTFSIGVEKDGVMFRLSRKDKVTDKAQAEALFRKLEKDKSVTITKVEQKETAQEALLLYDLTGLQQDANRRHGFSADQTLSIAQKLYERKLISYPRTASTHIPDDVFAEIPVLVDCLKTHPIFGNHAASLVGAGTLNKRSVDGSKITDHHALLITGNLPEKLGADEQTVYDMIAGRMLEAFSMACIKDVLLIQAETSIGLFETKGIAIKKTGWRAVFNLPEKDNESVDDAIQALPLGGLGELSISEGATFTATCINMLQKATKPKPLFTEATLLAAMETAANQVEEDDQQAAMKDCGIGTPATRASIIETLVKRGYVERDGKALKPTVKGLQIYDAVKSMLIADVQLTGAWESRLAAIEKDPSLKERFSEEIRDYTCRIWEEISSLELPASQISHFCPKCKLGKVTIRGKVAKCSYPPCNLTVFRTICGKTLTEGQTSELIKNGRTALLKGFKGKNGKTFDARLKFNEEFHVVFEFEKRS